MNEEKNYAEIVAAIARACYDTEAAQRESIEGRILDIASRLLDALFIPVAGGMQTDPARFAHFGVNMSEPVNWGALQCFAVETLADGTHRLFLDEAEPNGCPTLCAYLQKYLAAYGWKVEVETEW